MEEIWYIKIFRGVEGPYSKKQLKKDTRLNPDTFVWREGFEEWKKIKEVPELDDLFEEEVSIDEELKDEKIPEGLDEELVLNNKFEPPPNLYWILLALIIIAYFAYSYLFGIQG